MLSSFLCLSLVIRFQGLNREGELTAKDLAPLSNTDVVSKFCTCAAAGKAHVGPGKVAVITLTAATRGTPEQEVSWCTWSCPLISKAWAAVPFVGRFLGTAPTLPLLVIFSLFFSVLIGHLCFFQLLALLLPFCVQSPSADAAFLYPSLTSPCHVSVRSFLSRRLFLPAECCLIPIIVGGSKKGVLIKHNWVLEQHGLILPFQSIILRCVGSSWEVVGCLFQQTSLVFGKCQA